MCTKKSLQKSLYTQQKKLSSLTRDFNLSIFTANKTFTNLQQYELSQKKSDLLKAGLYFSIQPDKIRKSEIFTNFEKFHRSFINNLKCEETKSQITAHLSYFANSYFYNCKPWPHILRQHCVLQNLRKNKDIKITKPDKGNGVVVLDRNFYNNAIEEIIADTSKFENPSQGPTLKREASIKRFLHKLKQKNFFNEIKMMNCILLVLLLLVSILLLKSTNSPLVIHFLNVVWLFHLLLVIILLVSFVIFFHL